MSNDAEDRFARHEALMTGLARLHEAQHGIHERLTTAIERLDGAIARLDITQARIETLLARMLRHEENGREA